MTRFLTGTTYVLISISWIAAIAAALTTEYVGWHAVIADHNVAGGLAIAFFGAPIVFMTVQTVLGLLAAPFGMLAERRAEAELVE